MKKKTLLMTALALATTASLVIGGTLAFFTDTEKKDNVFTVGNVDIVLHDEFEQNSKLIPLPDNEAMIEKMKVKKIVTVSSIGSMNPFVRLHIAIPDAFFDGEKELLHLTGRYGEFDGWEWKLNAYPYTDDQGVLYRVHVVTYVNPLFSGNPEYDHAFAAAFNGVYLDQSVTQEDIQAMIEAGAITVNEDGNAMPQIRIIAEGIQSEGFETSAAYDFGPPKMAFNSVLPYSATSNPFVGYAK